MLYNYPHFTPEVLVPNGFPGPKAGEPLLDVPVFRLDGTRTRLKDILPADAPVVLETGSRTCPSFLNNLAAMNQLAREFAHVRFFVLYVREAHPGSGIGPHGSLEEKLAQAKRLLEEGETRTVLVDDLDGSAHRAYGSLPNMMYVINPERTVICRADWANAEAIRKLLLALEDDKTAMMHREHQTPNFPGLPRLVSMTRRAGWDATFDLVRSLPAVARIQRASAKQARRAS